MKNVKAWLTAVVVIVSAAVSGCASVQPRDTATAVPKNIIILFGDGAAATQWELGRYSSRVLRNKLFAVTDVVFKEGSVGLLTVHSADAFVVDSAAAFVLFVENENIDTAGHRNDAAALIRDLWAFDDAVQVALDFQRRSPDDTLIIVTGDHETGGLSVTYALKDLSSLSSSNRYYPADAHLQMVGRIRASLNKVAEQLGRKPTPGALDKVIAEHFPGFTLDADLRSAILEGRALERNVSYVLQGALGRMVSRQTGFYWGTTGHTTEPVVEGALGPGAPLFRGYMDNTDFAKILHKLIDGTAMRQRLGR